MAYAVNQDNTVRSVPAALAAFVRITDRAAGADHASRQEAVPATNGPR